MNYDGIELFEIEEREGKYYEKPNLVEKYLRRDMTEWNELCLPQYVKMFDPTSQNNNENEEEEDEDIEESENDDYNRKQKEEAEQKFESDKAKYKSEVKFHYLITGTGELGKPLPNLMELKNPYPGEPRFLRKRRHPKSLRLYKVKKDLNPERFSYMN